MLPGLMLAVALTTDPAVVFAWPVSERDAELAASEAALRDRMAERLGGIKFFEEQKKTYSQYLNSVGGGTEQERKQIAVFARRMEECRTGLIEARERVEEIQQLRQKERKLRVEPPKAEKK